MQTKKEKADRARKWRREHPERVRELCRRWRLAHAAQLAAKHKLWYRAHREFCLSLSRKWAAENPDRIKESSRAWRLKHPELYRERSRQGLQRHPEKAAEYFQRWSTRPPEAFRATQRRRYVKVRDSVRGQLYLRVSHGIQSSLHGNKAGRSWETLVGYTLPQLKAHLESLFTEGMTWELFMQGKIHIDHIFPLSRLIFESAEDPTFKYAWSLGNLQPLWADANRRKNSKIPWEFEKKAVA